MKYIIEFDSIQKILIVICQNNKGTIIWKISGEPSSALQVYGDVKSADLFFLAGYCATKTELPKHENMWILNDVDWAAAITVASLYDAKNICDEMGDEIKAFNLY